MNIKLDSNLAKVKINGTEVDKVKYNGAVVWEKPAAQHIYGVSWNKANSSSVLTRTDESANFSNPVIYNANTRNYGSPFDTLAPWKDIVRETINGEEFVKIPKFWYKIENLQNTMTIQIATYAETGFQVSPAHRARGPWGERDYVYIGRYKASYVWGQSLHSVSGANYIAGTAATLRGYTKPGTAAQGYFLNDFSMLFTIWLLYLVEFADWNSQGKISYGCNPSSGTPTTGGTDNMPYHTGNVGNGSYGQAFQYRYIEGLWAGNVEELVDGILYSSDKYGVTISECINPNEYGDTSKYIGTGSAIKGAGYITNWLNSTGAAGYTALFPGATQSSRGYVNDTWEYLGGTNYPIGFGGYRSQSTNAGLFHLDGPYGSTAMHCRLQYIPQT